jgi:hypothetical protein
LGFGRPDTEILTLYVDSSARDPQWPPNMEDSGRKHHPLTRYGAAEIAVSTEFLSAGSRIATIRHRIPNWKWSTDRRVSNSLNQVAV